MKHQVKRIGFCLAILALAQALALSAAEALRVGVTASLPPMVFKQGGKIVGVEADFAAALGKELGREVKFVEVDWENQIPALLDGKTDIIMSSMSITRARQYRVQFCTPYIRIAQMPLVRSEDTHKYVFGIPNPPKGAIGVKKATTGDFLVQQEFPRAKRKEFSTGEQAAKALAKKQIDMYISDATMVWWLAAENEANGLTVAQILLSEEPLAWAVRKADTELLAAANAAFAKWEQDGSATTIIKRWIPTYTK